MASPSVVWHAYPLGLLGADQTGRDRTCHASLRELAAWLPHVASLGADTILLGPIFSSVSHGYDTISHLEVDDRLGSVDDLVALIEAAGAMGIGIVLDGAFAYTSRAFWRTGDPAERVDPWLQRDPDGRLVPWRVESLVSPDYDATGYQAYVANVMTTWLDAGVAGWRLDSAWSVPAAFWRRVLTRVRQTHPSAWFLGQVFDDDLPPVVDHATYSSATEYAFMHGVREWLSGGSTESVAEALLLHGRNSSRQPVHTFLGNHDFARLADTVDEDLVPAAFAVLLTVPGVPATYYGDELLLRSDWTNGGSDALLRPPLSPSDPARASGPAATVLDAAQRLGAFRRANGWLTHGEISQVRAERGSLAYRTTGREGQSVEVHVNPTGVPGGEVQVHGRRVLSSSPASAFSDSPRIPPRSWAVLL